MILTFVFAPPWRVCPIAGEFRRRPFPAAVWDLAWSAWTVHECSGHGEVTWSLPWTPRASPSSASYHHVSSTTRA